MTRDIRAEGLAEPALEAFKRAEADGVRLADACLADLEAHGGWSVVARLTGG